MLISAIKSLNSTIKANLASSLQVSCLILLSILSSCNKPTIQTSAVIENDRLITMEAELIELINDYREEIGLNRLIYCEHAYTQATQHTIYMISKGILSHDNLKTRAITLGTKVEVNEIAENVAKNYASAHEAFTGWYESEEHRQTIEGNYSYSAVSIKANKQGELYMTQIFYR